YFGSVSHVGELLRRYREHYPDQNHLFLLTQGVNQIDVAGAELLVNEANARKAIGGDLYIYQLKDSAMKVINRGGYIDELNPANIFDSKEEAISTIYSRLDKDICAACENRIFVECGSSSPEDRRRWQEDTPPEATLP
ncbi:MAG: SulP family sulfate permease, partial [Chitinophagales bacterium]